MDMERYWRWSNRRNEQIRQRFVAVSKDIERMLFRFWRGNQKMTAEVLDARAERKRIWGE